MDTSLSSFPDRGSSRQSIPSPFTKSARPSGDQFGASRSTVLVE